MGDPVFAGFGYLGGMNDLKQHYRDLLGLNDSWLVDEVDLDLDANRVRIMLQHRGGSLQCPDCGQDAPGEDTAPQRTWRHLDTMQFTTEIVAAVPRCRCHKCAAVKTTAVPWATKHSRFTLMFEAFAIRVLQSAANVKRAAELLKISWKAAHRIMEGAVERGLDRRSEEEVPHLGVDEKSFRSGQDYVSVLTDIQQSRVLEVVPGRTIEACEKLYQSLSESQLETVESVSMDMWQAFMTSTRSNVPNAAIVHDRFHVSKYLGEAIDKVRRTEHRELTQQGDDSLKGMRQLFLYNLENLDSDAYLNLSRLQLADLKTGEAWSIKENFRHFWDLHDRAAGSQYFANWHWWASRSGLKPIVKVAEMLKNHLDGLLNYFTHRVTNATSEGFNSRIRSIKSAARGFRKFENYRIRILFYCGKLDLQP